MKKFAKFFLGASLALLLGVGAYEPVTETASAETTGAPISFTDTFIAVLENEKLVEGGEATLVKYSHAYEYSNVVNDRASGFGLVTGAKWGAFTSAGNGYITYKFTADEGYTLGDLDLSFTAAMGHRRLSEFWPKMNVMVSVSENNATFEKVYDLEKSRGYSDTGFAVHEGIGLDLDWFAENKTTVYVRFDLEHPTFADLTEAHQKADNIANDETQTIILQMLGVQLHEVSFSATQVAPKTQAPATEYATVTLDFDGEKREISVPVGEKLNPAQVVLPDGFVRESFELYVDESCQTVFDGAIEGDCTLFVKGSRTTYAIEYVLNGGENPSENPSAYSPVTGTALKNAYREGYYFVGWYEDENFTKRVESVVAGSQGEITLYAKWLKAESFAHGVETKEASGCGGSVSVLSGTLLLVGVALIANKRK